MLKKLIALALAAAACPAWAEIIVWRFDFFDHANFSYQWGWIGDEIGRIEGEVIGTRVVFTDYMVEGNIDAADFRFTFDVPALGEQTHIRLTGTDMGWSGAGPVSYTLETTAYNGPTREGRFGAEITGCEELPCGGLGVFAGAAYIELTIDGVHIRPDEIFFDGFDDIW